MRQIDGTQGTNAGISVLSDAGVAQQFMSGASRLLAQCIDYEDTLTAIAGMAFPYAGSWCMVDIADPDGNLRRVDVIHPDPASQEYARRLKSGWPLRRSESAERASGWHATELIPDVTDDLLVSVATDEEDLRHLRGLGIGSVLVIPLIARASMLGSIAFITAAGKHVYSDRDVPAAEDLAARCAMALDNARLFRDAENARASAAELNQQLVISSIRMQELAEQARDASNTKSRFLATMSHEIRTPINAIVGYADLLDGEVGGPLTPQQHDYLARMQASSRHLIALVDDILDIAKVEAGRLSLKRETVVAAESIGNALSLIEAQASAAGVRLDGSCADARIAYVGDADRVRQILVILLTNAVKFTNRGGSVHVGCGLRNGALVGAHAGNPGPWVYLTVEDTGIGISEQDAVGVFDAFVQVDQQSTRTRGGSGLGLAIGLDLARRMGGDLTLHSVMGDGSRFTLWLPASAELS